MVLRKQVIEELLNYSKAYLYNLYCFDCSLEDNYKKLENIFNLTIGKHEKDYKFNDYIKDLDSIKQLLDLDLLAAFNGDPAANSKDEIILTYPGFNALIVYRIAHQLYLKKLDMIPRMMSEIAHSTTSIDIHPGATIGKSFFIDHGTGVVIGQTCIIGDNVRIYQGVTLGALSLKNVDKVRNIKRHPTIKNNCIIYSNASILGGDTVIGNNCIIGSNVFLTTSIEDNKKVYLDKKNYTILDNE